MFTKLSTAACATLFHTHMARADIRVGRDGVIDETALPERAVTIIEIRKARAGTYANREITLMYWEIGHYINSVLLGGERAE